MRHRKKTAIPWYYLSALAAGVVLAGCSLTFPKAPDVATQQGRECVRTCQKQYHQCSGQCTGLSLKAASRKACRDDCTEGLRDCYDYCAAPP